MLGTCFYHVFLVAAEVWPRIPRNQGYSTLRAEPAASSHHDCLTRGMSGLKSMLKLGFPVRDRPQRRRACASCVARPGQPSSPNHLALVAAHSCQPGVCTHISPRTPRRLVDGPVASSSSPPPPPYTPPTARAHHASRSIHRILRLHPPHPTSCRRRGGASPSAPSASSCCTRSCPSSSCRRSTAFGRAGARQHPPHRLACVHRPPPAPHPCRCPLRPCYPLLPPPTPSCPSHSRRTPSRCTCAGLAWHRSMA